MGGTANVNEILRRGMKQDEVTQETKRTRSWVEDNQGKKIYLGDLISDKGDSWEVLDFQYIKGATSVQYLKLVNIKNRNKIMEFVDSRTVSKKDTRRQDGNS